jgi:hypothetical protein
VARLKAIFGRMTQIWVLRSRLEKQPTDLRRRHHHWRDGAPGRRFPGQLRRGGSDERNFAGNARYPPNAAGIGRRANLSAMDIREARLAFAATAAGWNVPLPDQESENIVLDGVPCRILLLYGCFEPRFDSDSHKRNGDGHCGLSIGGGTG